MPTSTSAAPASTNFNGRMLCGSLSISPRSSAEMESSSAKTRKLASMAVLPELRNGDTTPESGSRPSTPELISSISKAMRLARPSPRKKP